MAETALVPVEKNLDRTQTRPQALLIFISILFVASLYLLGPVLTPFFIAFFIAYVTNPGVSRLEKAGIARWLSILGGTTVLLVIIGVVSLLFLPTLKEQFSNYLDRIPAYLGQLQEWVDPLIRKFTTLAADITNADEQQLESMTDIAKEALPVGVGGDAGAATVDLVKASTTVVVRTITNLFLIPVIAFYLLRDWNSITDNLKSVLPVSKRKRIVALTREVDEVLKSFLYGQLLVMLSLGAMYCAGLLLIGLEFSLLIGVVAGILSFVPFLGTAIGLIMASMVMITQADHFLEVWKVFLVFGVGQFIEGNFLTPKLVGEQVGLHPVIVIFAVLAGGHLFGFSGILLALPVAAVMWVIIKNLADNTSTI